MSDAWDKITQKWTSYPKQEYLLENLKEHQQISILESNVLIIALISGILINIFSDSIITIIKGQHSIFDIVLIVVSSSLIIFMFLFFKKTLSSYRPVDPTYGIQFSLDSLLLEEIIEELKQKIFYKEEFEKWYSIFEEKIIELFNNIPFLSKYEYVQKEVEQYDELRRVSLISDTILKNKIEIQTTPLESSEEYGKKVYYYDIYFRITFSVLQPGSPEARTFIENIYAGTTLIMTKIENLIVTTLSNL
jgi:hypothetical protein